MMTDLLIQNVQPRQGSTIDLLISGGRIQASGTSLRPNSPETTVIDAEGCLLFPGFVDSHTHLDKTLVGLNWYRHEVGPALIDKIENERKLRRERAIDPHVQSMRQARLSIAAGTTHIRTFVDIDTEVKLAGFEGVMRTREQLKDWLDIQVVAFPQSGMLIRPGTVDLMEAALQEGADVVGGLDPCSIDRDPVKHLDTIFALAEKYDVDIDIHLHEPGDLGAFSLDLIAERTRVLGWQGRVVVSHAFCLGGVDEAEYGRLVDLLIENDITIMSHGPSGSRPAPPVKRLREAGVHVCTGNDGTRDAWGPLNTPDMLLRTYLIAYRNNYRRDDEIEMLLDVATFEGARVLRDQNYGLQPGNQADFVLVDGETHVEAVIDRPPRWLVVKRGRIVAREGECLV